MEMRGVGIVLVSECKCKLMVGVGMHECNDKQTYNKMIRQAAHAVRGMYLQRQMIYVDTPSLSSQFCPHPFIYIQLFFIIQMKPYWPILLAFLLLQAQAFNFREVQIMSVSSTTINTIASYRFKLDRTTDNTITETAYNTQPVQPSAVVEVTFPNDFAAIFGTPTCLSVTVDSIAINSPVCSIAGTTIRITNVFTSLTNLLVREVVIMVGNILNPSPAIYTGSFSGYIGRDYAEPVGTGLQLTAGFFSECSLTFSPGLGFLANSVMVLSVRPNNNHPPGTTLAITFPRSFWTNDITSQALPIVSALTCRNYTSNINTGLQCLGTPALSQITVSNMFSTSTNDRFSLGVNNFLSAPSNQPSDAISITSFVGTSPLDTCVVYPSGLTPNNFNNFTITPLSAMVVNRPVSFRFDLTLSMTININDYFAITFPTEISFRYSNLFGTGFYLKPPTVSNKTVIIYHDTSINAQPYNRNTNYSITLASLTAPPSTLTTSPITIEVLRNGYPIMLGSSTLKALNSILNATLSVPNSVVWAQTSYAFTLNITNPLSSDGMIEIIFPPTILISGNSSSCAVLVGSNMSPNPTCNINRATNTILLSMLNQSSSIIPAQNNIRISLNRITNPLDVLTTSSFSIATYYSSSLLGLVDVGAVSGFTPTVGTISIATVSVVPSSYTVLQAGVTYNINFNNTYLIPLNGYIVLQMPTNIAISTASLPNYCKISVNNAAYTSAACSVQTFPLYNIITFTNPAATQPITPNSLLSLQIFQLCTNPVNTAIVTNFTISTFSPNAAIQRLTSGIIVQMTNPASFNSISVQRNSQQNSATTVYQFKLRQQAELPAGSILTINLPNDISMSSSSACKDGNNGNLACTTISFQKIRIILSAVSSNNEFTVLVDNVRNPPSYRPNSLPFTFSTTTADQISTFAEGPFTTALSNSVPNDFTQINYRFTPGAYLSPESLTVSLIPSANIIPKSFIVNLAASLTVNSLSCGSFIGFTGTCSVIGLSAVNISGTMGTSEMSFTISGFVSPSSPPNDFTILNSYDSLGFLIDQNSNTIKYSIACILPCRTCSSNTSSCLSCYNNLNISQFNIFNPFSNSCVVNCPQATFTDTTTLICTSCSTTCLTCSLLSTNCTACNLTSPYPALNLSNFNGVCLPACPSKFYLSTRLFPTQCSLCVQPCLTCQSETYCLTCSSGYYFYNFTCQTTCPAKISILNNQSRICEACATQCLACVGTVSTCDGCNINAALHEGKCLSACPFPLVINSGICANCSADCKSCSLISTNCTGCYPSTVKQFLLVTSSGMGSCNENCPFTYYGDTVNNICKLCSTLNIGCSNCSSTTTCFNCDFASPLLFYDAQCINFIPLGFYNRSGKAEPCNILCSGCTNSADNCTSCISLSLSNSFCVVLCPSGQVSVNKTCTPCRFPCLTCSNIQTNCTFCNSSAADPYYLSSGSCLKNCPNYTYPNAVGWTCSPCNSPCQICSSNATCISCSNGFNLFNQTCKDICPLGFIGLNKLCVACLNNCSSCLGSQSHCLSCVAGYYLHNSATPTCSTTCPTGLFINHFTQTCIGCSLPCLTCSILFDNCTSCSTALLLQNFSCLTNCSVGFYKLGSICRKCNLNCTRCVSQLICQRCIQGLVLSGSTCVLSCPLENPIVNANNICSSCTDTFCLNCNSSNYCFSCFFPKLTFRGTCLIQSQCPTNYTPDSNFTTCIYNPTNPNSTATAEQILQSSLQTTSIFPVPFTITAVFIAIASLMSKFQYSRTNLAGSLYSLWGLLQWGSIVLLLMLQFFAGADMSKLSLLFVAGGILWIYLMNLVFLVIQNYSLRNDKRLRLWLQGSINSCWYTCVSVLGLLTTNKLKQILFCKMFNFRVLSIKLEDVGRLRVYYIYTFVSIFASLATIAGSVILLIDSKLVVNQHLMSYIDVLVLSLLQLALGFLNVQKEEDFFQDLDEDGLHINKRIEVRDEEPNSGIMPSYAQFAEFQKRQNLLMGLQSAKKFQHSDYLSQRSLKSKRDISIQAQSILGERSLISRLGTEQISQFSMFQGKHDVSIQMDEVKEFQDKSIQVSRQHYDVSISANQPLEMVDVSINARALSKHDVSIDQTPEAVNEVSVQYNRSRHEVSIQMDRVDQHQISIQYVPMYTDHTVQMTFDEEEFGIQCNAEQQNISVQYTAKPIFQNLSQSFPSQAQFSNQEPTDLQIQRKLIQNLPAQQERGMKAELQLDIEEKLHKKRQELQYLVRQRRERQKEEQVQNFKRKVSMKEQRGVQGRDDDEDLHKINRMFNNERSKQDSSEFHSREEFMILRRKQEEHSQIQTEKDLIQMLETHNQNEEDNLSFTLTAHAENHRPNVFFQNNNHIIQDQEDIIDEDDQDITRNYELIDNNYAERQVQQPSILKSTSTAQNTHSKPPLPSNKRPHMLDSSNNSVHNKEDPNLSITNQPLNPKYQQHHINEQDFLQHKNRTNLSQFLDNKKKTLNSSENYKRKNHFMEEDALTRQIQNEIHQKPLPAASLETFKTQKSGINYQRQPRDAQRQINRDFQFDNNDRIFMSNEADEELMIETRIIQAQKALNKHESQPKLPRSTSKNKISNEIGIERSNRPSFMRNTYSSQEKRKSLQKIYLNKLIKK